MAEGGCEKFPDHWNPEFFWTVIVEYLSHGHPVDILVKRWVIIRILFPSLPPFVPKSDISISYLPSKLNVLTNNTFIFLFQDFSILGVQEINFGI